MKAKPASCRSKLSAASKKKGEACPISLPHPIRPSASCDVLWPQLDGYQRDAAEFALQVKTAGLFFEQGTGKTWISGAVIERMLHENFQGLVVARLSNLRTTWEALLSRLPVRVCLSLDDFQSSTGARVLLLHYEALPRVRKKLSKMPWSLIIYDESQSIKSRGTIASRIAASLGRRAERKIILSGTPIESRPSDLWAQFRFLRSEVFGARWADFENEYLEPVAIDLKDAKPGSMRYARLVRARMIQMRKRAFRADKLPQFLETIKPYCLRVTKEVANLPSLTITPVEVTLRGSQRRLYDELSRDLVTSLFRLTAPLKVTLMGKLQQITGGHVMDDDGELHHVGEAKQRTVARLVARLEAPVVIFAKYLAEVDRLHSILGGETITGRQKDRVSIIQKFQEGRIPVLICQIKTGGVGIDLFRACNAIIYSPTHSHIDYEQAISRLHRRGQSRDVTIYTIVARNTIDEAIFTALSSKRDVITSVLQHLKDGGSHGREKGH